MKQARGHVDPLRGPTIIFRGDADFNVDAQNGAELFAASGRSVLRKAKHFVRTARFMQSRAIDASHQMGASLPSIGSCTVRSRVVGGDASDEYNEPGAPDATTEMLALFLSHRLSES